MELAVGQWPGELVKVAAPCQRQRGAEVVTGEAPDSSPPEAAWRPNRQCRDPFQLLSQEGVPRGVPEWWYYLPVAAVSAEAERPLYDRRPSPEGKWGQPSVE